MDVTPREKLELSKLVEVDWDGKLGNRPFGQTAGFRTANYGKLDNGLTYYVHCNPKPQMRAALALAVKVGSVLEEEFERGVAHIVEHLAFSATKSYRNHDIVKFLESIGADLGACANAHTSYDETVYKLLIPIDKPDILSKAISILAEFSTEIRLSSDDLDKERGPVLEEYRCRRNNARGRLLEARWATILEGSKYAERLPIGLEKVIRTVQADVVHGFYTKWYNLHNMAVVAVGDFSDTQIVIDLIKEHFGQISSPLDFPPIPFTEVPLHEEPRFSCFDVSGASRSNVFLSWKIQRRNFVTVRDLKDGLVHCMFLRAMNQRLNKIRYERDPPYISCSIGENLSLNPIEGFQISASCRKKEALKAFESILMELARVRLHGFSEREISVARALLLSKKESAYAKPQTQSSTLRDIYIEHFLHDVLMVDGQLYKTIFPKISASEVSKYAEKFRISCNCVVMIFEPYATSTVDDLSSIVQKICSLEEEKEISPWGDESVPEEIVFVKSNPGNIVQQSEYPDIGITELTLSNGMKVCYKCTDFNKDQIILEGYSYGGYSELRENYHLSCIKASSLAQEIGKFGHKPSVLADMLAGKRAEVKTSLLPYMRRVFGDCSPSYLETALQLVYQLFVTEVEQREEHIKRVKQITEENIRANERDPYTSSLYKQTKFKAVKKIDPVKACEYFNNCFKDPSTFTILIVGNIDPDTAHPLILEYLGGIPKPPKPIFQFNRDNLKGLPCNSYSRTTRTRRVVVRSWMAEAQCSVHISFRFVLKSTETTREEFCFVDFLTRLLSIKLMQVLRWDHGKIYNVDVSSSLDSNSRPSRKEDLRGDVSIDFSCDPDASSVLVDMALNEIQRLQEHGPSEEDLSSVLEIEQRAHENGLQENYYWMRLLLSSYQSRFYDGDVSCSFQAEDKARTTVRQALTPLTAKRALQRVLPYPCKEHYTTVILMPRRFQFNPFQAFQQFIETTFDSREKVVAGLAGLAIFTMSICRSSQKG